MKEVADGAVTEDEIPLALRNRPVLNQFQMVYWEAFQDLTGSRQYTSAGIAEIPFKAKIDWLDEEDIVDPDERRDYKQMITVLDNAYVASYHEKAKVA